MLPVSDILKSNGAHKRKRKVIKNETKHRYNEPDRRVLRSGKDNAKQALPRRSRRLILKVLYSIHTFLRCIVLYGLIYANLYILVITVMLYDPS